MPRLRYNAKASMQHWCRRARATSSFPVNGRLRRSHRPAESVWGLENIWPAIPDKAIAEAQIRLFPGLAVSRNSRPTGTTGAGKMAKIRQMRSQRDSPRTCSPTPASRRHSMVSLKPKHCGSLPKRAGQCARMRLASGFQTGLNLSRHRFRQQALPGFKGT